MPKISDYPESQTVLDDDLLLMETMNGTRKITGKNAKETIKQYIGDSKQVSSTKEHFDILDKYADWTMRRDNFRGNYLGDYFTVEQKMSIYRGDFKGFFLGDYWQKNGVTWRIMDINYFYNKESPNMTLRHLIIMPDQSLYNSVANDENNTAYGYTNMKLRTEAMIEAKQAAIDMFGSLNILNHKELLVNSYSSTSVGNAWFDSMMEIPTVAQILGLHFGNPTWSICSQQFAVFTKAPWTINASRSTFWTRDPSGPGSNYVINGVGSIDSYNLNTLRGIRPYFAVAVTVPPT